MTAFQKHIPGGFFSDWDFFPFFIFWRQRIYYARLELLAPASSVGVYRDAPCSALNSHLKKKNGQAGEVAQ